MNAECQRFKIEIYVKKSAKKAEFAIERKIN